MTTEGNDPLTKMAISATQLTLFFAIFLRYFSRLHRTNFSQIPQDLSLSCNPGLLLFWLLLKARFGQGDWGPGRSARQTDPCETAGTHPADAAEPTRRQPRLGAYWAVAEANS